MNTKEIAAALPQYEGLIYKTASMIVDQLRTRQFDPPIELGLDDIRQRLRIKVWKGLESYDRVRARGAGTMRAYVFMCVTNEKKDILKLRRRADAHIEDEVTVDDLPDAFELRYLSADPEQVFASVEAEQLELPASLTVLERQVIGLLYEGLMQTEVRSALSLSVRAISEVVSSIREKMADWRPSTSERALAPTPPLPRALHAQPSAPCAAAPLPALAARAGGPNVASAAPAAPRPSMSPIAG